MKSKIVILSTYDIYITIPLLNKISIDERAELKKVFFLRDKSSLIKKIKILLLLNFNECLKLNQISTSAVSCFQSTNQTKQIIDYLYLPIICCLVKVITLLNLKLSY